MNKTERAFMEKQYREVKFLNLPTRKPLTGKRRLAGGSGVGMQDRERIEALEKGLGKFESEVNENLTMVLGQVWKQIEIARSIRGDVIGFKALVNLEFEEVDQRLDGLSKGIQTIQDRQDFLEKRIDSVDSKLDLRFDGLSKRIDSLDSKLDQILARLPKVED